MRTIAEKQNFLCQNYPKEWLKIYEEIRKELSEKCYMFCFCRKLCTGMHETYCARFKNKVISESLKKAKHLLK